MRLHRSIALACLAALALGIGYFLGRGVPPSVLPAPVSLGSESGELGKTTVSPSPRLTREPPSKPTLPKRPPAPLPPPGTALAKIYDSLAARARNGDTVAAMRLLSDLQRCSGRRTHAWMLSFLDDRLSTQHATGDERNAELKPILD